MAVCLKPTAVTLSTIMWTVVWHIRPNKIRAFGCSLVKKLGTGGAVFFKILFHDMSCNIFNDV